MLRRLTVFLIFSIVVLAGGLLVWNHFRAPIRHAAMTRATMDYVALEVASPDGKHTRVLAKQADTLGQWRVGMSYMAPGTMRHYYIWHTFDKASDSSLYARHARRPLGVAWVNGAGIVIDTDRLEPGGNGVRPPKPVHHAFEATAPALRHLGLKKGADVDVAAPPA